MENNSNSAAVSSRPLSWGSVITRIEQGEQEALCSLIDGRAVACSQRLGALLHPADTLLLPDGVSRIDAGTEFQVRRAVSSRPDLLQIGSRYARAPGPERKGGGESGCLIELPEARFGLQRAVIPYRLIRDYFYVADRGLPWAKQGTLYDALGAGRKSHFAAIRLAHKIKSLECRTVPDGSPRQAVLDRILNILADPERRTVYDRLLEDGDVPVPFPYGGFGTLLLAGERQGDLWIAKRILSFVPQSRRRSVRISLRDLRFGAETALYRDAGRKLEIWLDPGVLPLRWDASWAEWSRFLPGVIEVGATFVRTGRYRQEDGEWRLREWERSVPAGLSVVTVDTADRLASSVETAKRIHREVACRVTELALLRAKVETEALEYADMQAWCRKHGIPPEFDLFQLHWHAEYDPSYHRELAREAKAIYLLRDEYIFEWEQVLLIEIAKAGRATYLFRKPDRLERFLRLYAETARQKVAHNDGGIATILGYVGKVSHKRDHAEWRHALQKKLTQLTSSKTGGNR